LPALSRPGTHPISLEPPRSAPRTNDLIARTGSSTRHRTHGRWRWRDCVRTRSGRCRNRARYCRRRMLRGIAPIDQVYDTGQIQHHKRHRDKQQYGVHCARHPVEALDYLTKLMLLRRWSHAHSFALPILPAERDPFAWGKRVQSARLDADPGCDIATLGAEHLSFSSSSGMHLRDGNGKAGGGRGPAVKLSALLGPRIGGIAYA
jgi:hypothetical protein